jgi:hypothetical protein
VPAIGLPVPSLSGGVESREAVRGLLEVICDTGHGVPLKEGRPADVAP